MSELNQFDGMRMKIASAEKSDHGLTAKLKSQRQSTIEP